MVSAAKSPNLQYGGSRIFVLDVYLIPNLLQIVGRAFRVGQQHVQDVTVCVNDETYDQVLLWKAIEKYRPMISASAYLPTTKHQHDRIGALLKEALSRSKPILILQASSESPPSRRG